MIGVSDAIEYSARKGTRTWGLGLFPCEPNSIKAGTVHSAGGAVLVQMPDEAVFTLAGALER